MRAYEDLTTGAGKVQADGAITITSIYITASTNINRHQLVIEPVLATVGTFAIEYKPRGASGFMTLKTVAGVAVTHDLAAGKFCYIHDGNVESFKFTPTGVDSTYNVKLSAWEM